MSPFLARPRPLDPLSIPHLERMIPMHRRTVPSSPFRRVHLLAPAVAALGALGLLAACGGGESAGEPDVTELHVGYNAQPPSLDPHMSTANATADFMRGVFEPLVALDENDEVQPVLASDMVPNEDYSEITFTILEKPMHDGSTLDSTDVKDSIERWQASSPAGSYFADVTWETPDDRTLVFSSPEPFYSALTLLADPSQFPAVMSSEAIAAAGPEGLTEFVGTGPYSFVEWADNQYVHLEMFADYQAVENEYGNIAGTREPVYENIYFDIVPDANTRLAGLQTGEYDIITQVLPDQKPQLENDPTIEMVTKPGGIAGPVFNKAPGQIFADENMRHAVVAGTDVEEALRGAYAAEDNYILNGSLGFEDTPWYAEPGEEYAGADVQKAQEYLDAAGYDGEPVKLIATRDYVDHYDAGVVVEQQMKDLGIDVTLEVYDWPTVLQMASEESATDMYMSSWAPAAIPTKYTFMSTLGNGVTDDPDLFAAVDAVHHAPSAEAAQAAMPALQEEFDRYLPMMKLGDYTSTVAWSTEIANVETPLGVTAIYADIAPVE
ncbi:ABC transporter substrate-binding protein [Brevibacterium litoralis]|uniref:ABC transporter substrate-binding protein n=1 Tax=Brevibacterium litoralis TaxID=3138935 RepID=UPI0032EE362D